MISCPKRAAVRKQTLKNLAATDWGDEPVLVQVDEGRFDDAIARITQTAHLALTHALGRAADYILFLEDDLEFNRHLRHNLQCWTPVRRDAVTLAGLYNPGLPALACDVRRNLFVANAHSIFGSQAFLLSAATARFILEHWHESESPPDLRMPRLAVTLGQPIFYHAPSLVQHAEVTSTWGGVAHQAADFDPVWRA